MITVYFTETMKKGPVLWDKERKIWYDRETEHLEGLIEKKVGYFRKTEDDAVMAKVDTNGDTLVCSKSKVGS